MNKNEMDKCVDALKIILSNDYIQLDFGTIESENVINKEASVKIEPNMLKSIILHLFEAGIEYENKTGEKIGFDIREY